MMKVFLLRFGELFLKGENRKFFEHALEKDIQKKLENIPHKFCKTQGRYIISNFEDSDLNEIRNRLGMVFGLSSYSEAEEVDTSREEIEKRVAQIRLNGKSFKVEVKRADKTFPLTSMDFAKELGRCPCSRYGYLPSFP